MTPHFLDASREGRAHRHSYRDDGCPEAADYADNYVVTYDIVPAEKSDAFADVLGKLRNWLNWFGGAALSLSFHEHREELARRVQVASSRGLLKR